MPPDPEAAAAAATHRDSHSHLLHNFSFPILKTWGCQRHLRCANVNRNDGIIGRRSTAPRAAGPRIRAPDLEADGGGHERGLEEVRAKLLVHLREAADRLNLVVLPKPEQPPAEPQPEPAPEPSSSAADAVGPWNLRKTTRRRGSSSRAPIRLERHVSVSPAAERSNHARAVRLRSDDAERRERPRFSITLSRDEIEEDIYAVTGSMPRRRPRKRPRALQKQLDSLFPGSWLSEITADSYKVPD